MWLVGLPKFGSKIVSRLSSVREGFVSDLSVPFCSVLSWSEVRFYSGLNGHDMAR